MNCMYEYLTVVGYWYFRVGCLGYGVAEHHRLITLIYATFACSYQAYSGMFPLFLWGRKILFSPVIAFCTLRAALPIYL